MDSLSPSGSSGSRSVANRTLYIASALVAIAVVGIAVRAVLMPRLGHVADTYLFFEWATSLANRSVAAVYLDPEQANGVQVNYPPVYLYVLSLLPGFHDACADGVPWSDPGIVHGLRREALRLLYRDFAARVREAGTARRTLGPKAYDDTVADMESAGFGEEFRDARVRTYADLVDFFGQRLLAGSHLGAGHRSVLVFLKLPAALADLALAGLLFGAGWRWAGRWPAVLAAGGVFLSPVMIHESAYWGQVDSIPTALIVACLMALVARVWWLVFLLLVVALLTKLQAIIIAPVVAAVVVATFAKRWAGNAGEARKESARLAAALAVAGLGAAVLLFPIARGGALKHLLGIYTSLGSQYPYLTVRAFNLWWLFTAGDPISAFDGSPRDDVATFIGVTPKAIGLMLLLAIVGFVVAAIVKRRGDRPTVVLGALTVAMAFFCLQTEIHERYGYPIVPLAILAALVVSRRYWWVAAAASVTHFANLLFAGLAERPGGPPSSGLAVALATTPALTYALAAVNLALLAIAARDLYRRGFTAAPGPATPLQGTARHAGMAGSRRRR
jgi:hypothetical protein